MNKKLAKIKYLANNFEIIESGDHVLCAILLTILIILSSEEIYIRIPLLIRLLL